MTLGEEGREPVVKAFQGLRSSTRAKEDSSQPKRQIPRYLRVIVTPDDQQQTHHLEAEAQDGVAVLKWEKMVQYAQPLHACTPRDMEVVESGER
jgi:hypothetical protein